MLKKIEKGEANGILSWHADRLARNSLDGEKIIYHLDTGKLHGLKFMLSITFYQKIRNYFKAVASADRNQPPHYLKARPHGLAFAKSRLEQVNFLQEIDFKEKRKNFKVLYVTQMAQPVGHRKDCSYCQIAPLEKQPLNSVSKINIQKLKK